MHFIALSGIYTIQCHKLGIHSVFVYTCHQKTGELKKMHFKALNFHFIYFTMRFTLCLSIITSGKHYTCGKDYIFNASALATYEVQSQIECAAYCTKDVKCFSYNTR